MSTECAALHEKFSRLRRFSHGYWKDPLPSNGICIFFENGEIAHGTDRITGIGTHKREGGLPKRIKQHFHTPNKDGSSLRLHIGWCILEKRNDPFREQWRIDYSKKENRGEYAKLKERLKKIEQEVGAYMRENMSFVVIEIEDEQQRLDRKKQLICTISRCPDCSPSKNWLGLHHSNHKICKSGLWNDKHVSSLD